MIIKRIVLTGTPYKTIGRRENGKQRGHIEKAIGFTGRFKATFKEIVKPDNTICMYLYKRVFPQLCREDGSYVTAPASF
jgi:hypothetical protein